MSGQTEQNKNKAEPLINSLVNYNQTQADAINRILGRNSDFEIELQEGGFEFSFLFRKRACRTSILIALCAGTIDFVLGFERCLFSNRKEVEDLNTLPLEIRNLYVEVLFKDVCERLETWTGLPIRIKNFGPGTQKAVPDSWRRLDFQMLRFLDGQRSEGFVITSDQGLQMISDLMAAMPKTPVNEYDDLILLGCVQIGRARLNLEKIKQIEPHDIILIDASDGEPDDYELDEWPCRVYPAPDLYLETLWDQTENHIIFLSNIEEGFMSNHDDNPENLNSEASEMERIEALDELPIELNFDIGSIPISLRELKCVREGFIFEIQHSNHSTVRIRVNGKLIGSGELVRLNGHMGVRVLDLPRTTI